LIGVIGFATPGRGTTDPSDAEVEADERREYCLKLVFRDEQAAYYQYPLFPDLNAHYILGAMRKRTGAVQHLRVTLSSPEVLQAFIESCHVNPHLLRVEKSTVDEFDRAASNAV